MIYSLLDLLNVLERIPPNIMFFAYAGDTVRVVKLSDKSIYVKDNGSGTTYKSINQAAVAIMKLRTAPLDLSEVSDYI
jgi:hypothetical protein